MLIKMQRSRRLPEEEKEIGEIIEKYLFLNTMVQQVLIDFLLCLVNAEGVIQFT